ncbi:16547_t:CDS:2, partial [Acaulospora colombiana]
MASISRTIASRAPLQLAKVRSLACLHAVKHPASSSLPQRTYTFLSNLGLDEPSTPKPTQPVSSSSTPLLQKTETVTDGIVFINMVTITMSNSVSIASSSSKEGTSGRKSVDAIWDTIVPEIRAAALQSRDALLSKGGMSPEEVWKKRSEAINSTMRMEAVGPARGKALDRPGFKVNFGGAAGVTQLAFEPMYQPPSVTSGINSAADDIASGSVLWLEGRYKSFKLSDGGGCNLHAAHAADGWHLSTDLEGDIIIFGGFLSERYHLNNRI